MKTFKEIANLLVQTFEHNSSSDHYTEKCQCHKRQQEQKPINFKTNTIDTYNEPFKMRELDDCLSRAKDSASGRDDIHYQMLKHLPFETKEVLLEIFNHIFSTGSFPSLWREATVIPIPKPGKDNSKPGSYRPIALTSCLCKIMERLINNRLVWYLESHNLITDYQAGFRKNRSTEDQLVRFETLIRGIY